MKKWVMTLRQAEALERAAKLRRVTVEELVDEALKGVGTQRETVELRRKILEQAEWLLDGKPAERAPYIEEFGETLSYPFWESHLYGPQRDMPIDEFVKLCEELARQPGPRPREDDAPAERVKAAPRRRKEECPHCGKSLRTGP
jgi:hypothetical protein